MTLFHIFLSLLGTLTWATEVISTAPVANIYWNRTNEIFLPTNNHHIIDVRLKDTIKFLCPEYGSNAETPELENYIIYRVPKNFFDSCYIPVNSNDAQLKEQNIHRIHSCTASSSNPYTVFIDNFYALPDFLGGLPYEAGKIYYFTTLSTGRLDGINNRLSDNSACKRYNMKAVVRVCCNENATTTCPPGAIKCNQTDDTTTSHTDPPLVTGNLSQAPTTTQKTTTETTTSQPPTTKPPVTWTTLKTLSTTKESKTTEKSGSYQPRTVSDNSSARPMISTLTLLLSIVLVLLTTGQWELL